MAAEDQTPSKFLFIYFFWKAKHETLLIRIPTPQKDDVLLKFDPQTHKPFKDKQNRFYMMKVSNFSVENTYWFQESSSILSFDKRTEGLKSENSKLLKFDKLDRLFKVNEKQLWQSLKSGSFFQEEKISFPYFGQYNSDFCEAFFQWLREHCGSQSETLPLAPTQLLDKPLNMEARMQLLQLTFPKDDAEWVLRQDQKASLLSATNALNIAVPPLSNPANEAVVVEIAKSCAGFDLPLLIVVNCHGNKEEGTQEGTLLSSPETFSRFLKSLLEGRQKAETIVVLAQCYGLYLACNLRQSGILKDFPNLIIHGLSSTVTRNGEIIGESKTFQIHFELQMFAQTLNQLFDCRFRATRASETAE